MLEEMFKTILKKFGEYISIPFIGILLAILFLQELFSTEESIEEFFENSDMRCKIIICAILFVVYIGYCIYHNRLPRAPKDCLSVLFVVDAEDDKMVDAVKYKLVNAFCDKISNIDYSKITAICINKKHLRKFNVLKTNDAIVVLKKTNCVFLVNVKYSVDSVDNAENFEMMIDYGVIHPEFNDAAESVLMQDMTDLSVEVRNRRFVKANTIETFKFTADALSYICQYVIGFVYLLSGEVGYSMTIFERVLDDLNKSPVINDFKRKLNGLVKNRLFVAYILTAHSATVSFENDYGLHYLRSARDSLEKANMLFKDTYDYNIISAYIAIALDSDLKRAKNCVEKCKQNKELTSWKYSDAFLSAYQGHAPSTIMSKYSSAFGDKSQDFVKLLAYIEFILEREPERYSLHLAAGLVYEKIGDARLMKKHFTKYLDNLGEKHSSSRNKIEEKMNNFKCDVECGHHCQVCSELSYG